MEVLLKSCGLCKGTAPAAQEPADSKGHVPQQDRLGKKGSPRLSEGECLKDLTGETVGDGGREGWSQRGGQLRSRKGAEDPGETEAGSPLAWWRLEEQARSCVSQGGERAATAPKCCWRNKWNTRKESWGAGGRAEVPSTQTTAGSVGKLIQGQQRQRGGGEKHAPGARQSPGWVFHPPEEPGAAPGRRGPRSPQGRHLS